MKKSLRNLATAVVLTLALVVGLGNWGGTIATRTPATLHPAAATDEIATVQQFLTFAQNCTQSADYSVDLTVDLTADLDFAGVNFVPVGNFAGTFNGNGHTLRNIKVTDGKTSTAVFNTVAHTATITDLKFVNLQLDGDNYVGLVGKNYGTLQNITVDGSINGKNFVGGLAADNGQSSERQPDDTDDETPSRPVTVEHYAQIVNCQNHATVTGQTYVGGIAGNNDGNVTDCTNHAAINGHKSNTNATVANVGGIAGNNGYRVVNCTNHGTINGGDDSTAVGGIDGLSTGEIYFAFNYGAVNGSHYVGGVCGLYGSLAEAEGGDNEDEPVIDLATHQITYTANQAPVTAVAHAGGIVGYAATTDLTLSNAASTGDVTVTAGNYAGGIIGFAENVTITSVTSRGTISAKGLNAGQYVGGIAGSADHITAASSTATLHGTDHLGGIAGYAGDVLQDCYTNVLLLPATDSTYVGLLAGTAHAFNASLNTFGDSVKNNYYLGDQGGIQGTQYATHFNNAAAQTTSDALTTLDLNSTAWQNDDATTYPTLRNLQTVEPCAAFADTATWTQMFTDHADTFTQLTQNNARVTYTVVFREWQQDNGDLTDDYGATQYDNFDTIATLRVAAGDPVTAPSLQYATRNADGVYTYQGDQAKYYVTLTAPTTVTANTTVYAQYTPIVTTLASPDRRVLVEGEFATGTTVELRGDADGYTLRFMLNGEELDITTATVKIKPDAGQNCVYLLDGDQATKVTTTPSGDYLTFTYDGRAFRLATDNGFALPVWAWVLIGVGTAALLTAVIVPVVVIKHKKQKPTPPTATATTSKAKSKTAKTPAKR